MKGTKDDIHEICKAIGRRIRSMRKENGFSLDALAKKTGFAKSYLSQIENTHREPPISTLAKIAEHLGTDVVCLLSGEAHQNDEQDFSIVKSSERKMIRRPFGTFGYMYESIVFKKLHRLMDAYVITTGFEFPSEPFRHEEEEFVYVLEGRQEIVYNDKSYTVEEGDCYYIASNRPHYTKSIGDKPAKVLAVFSSKIGMINDKTVLF